MMPYDVTKGLRMEYVIFRTQNRALGNTVRRTDNDNSPSTETVWKRLLRYDVIHARGIHVIPKCCSNRSSSVW